jgi:hypothetical protein
MRGLGDSPSGDVGESKRAGAAQSKNGFGGIRTMPSVKEAVVIFVIALVAVWAANNVGVIRNFTS